MPRTENPLPPDLLAHFDALDLISQDVLLDDLTARHNSKKEARRQALKAELGLLIDRPLKEKPVKASVKFRSLKDPSLFWSGRGARAAWLEAEMKESGKPLDAFRCS